MFKGLKVINCRYWTGLLDNNINRNGIPEAKTSSNLNSSSFKRRAYWLIKDP